MDQKIIEELQKMNKLLTLFLTKDMNQAESAIFISKAGFQPAEIAKMLGTTSNNIRVILSKNRTKKK